jgi:hypothetical protein
MVLSDRLKALQDRAPAGSENVVRSMVIQCWVCEQLFFNAKVLQDGDKPAIADMLGDEVHAGAKDKFIAKHMPELLVQSAVLPLVPSPSSSVEPIVSDATDSGTPNDGHRDDEPAKSERDQNDEHQSDDKKDEGRDDRDRNDKTDEGRDDRNGNDMKDQRRDDGEGSDVCVEVTRAVASQFFQVFSGAAVSKLTRQAVRQSITSSTASRISTLVPGASGKAIYGAAAKQHVAKVCGKYAGAAAEGAGAFAVPFAVSSVKDIRAHIKGDIDDEKLCKRMVNNAISTSASGVGSTMGAAWGTFLIPIPVVGTAVGGVLGGMIGNLMTKRKQC